MKIDEDIGRARGDEGHQEAADPLRQDLAEKRSGKPVLVQKGRIMAATFHPELTEDTIVHERFVNMAQHRPKQEVAA